MSAVKRRSRQIQEHKSRSAELLLTAFMGFAALLASAHFGYRYLSQPGTLPLRVVEITGEFSHLEHAAIEAEVAAAIDGGFFTVDMQAVRDAVRAMPWVEEVSVRRVWPDTLRMHVIEQVPLAHWGDAALVNLRGEVFETQDAVLRRGLPRLSGGAGKAPEVVSFYLQLRSALVGGPLAVSELVLNARQEWEVKFNNGLALMLGSEQPEARIADFFKVYPQLLAHMSGIPQRIDMRYEHGFAVQWQSQDALPGESLAGDS